MNIFRRWRMIRAQHKMVEKVLDSSLVLNVDYLRRATLLDIIQTMDYEREWDIEECVALYADGLLIEDACWLLSFSTRRAARWRTKLLFFWYVVLLAFVWWVAG